MKSFVRLLLVLVAMLAIPAPAVAFVPQAGLWDAGESPRCLGFQNDVDTLTNECGINWNNRANFVSASLLSGQCAAFYKDTNQSGAAWTLVGTSHGLWTPEALPSSWDDTISSIRVGDWTNISGGIYACVP